MMHEDKLPELEGLSISQPIQQEWEWTCQYSAMHQEYCEECNHCIQHVGLALQQGNLSLERAIEFPKHFVNKEFERGVDYGTRTCQEPVSSANEHLHAACHLMVHHLRIMEKERLDLLVRTMAVHSALNRAGHHNDELEECVKSLIQDLRDQRDQHVVLQIDQTPRRIQYNQIQYHKWNWRNNPPIRVWKPPSGLGLHYMALFIRVTCVQIAMPR